MAVNALLADRAPVSIEFVIGTKRLCFSFGGETKFKVGKKTTTFRAKDAPPATSCPPAG